MPENPIQPDERNLTLPPSLVADLRLLEARRVDIPRGLDAELLDVAQRRLGRRRLLVGARRMGAVLAAAAALGVVGWVGLTAWSGPRGGGPAPISALRKAAEPVWLTEVRAGRRPTILDAFALARLLRDGAATSQDYDINGDGRVDSGDVDALAQQAVQLTASSTQREGHG